MAESAPVRFDAGELLAELTGNVLPFWSSVPVDPAGGFHGAVGNDGAVDDTVERSAVLCSRVLWAFSTAATELDEPGHLQVAGHAYRYLRDVLRDPGHGGVFWSVAADGTVVDDRKHTYAQAFAIYGLVAYSVATDDDEPLSLAREIFELIEQHTADGELGGYVEAAARDWSPAAEMRLSLRDLDAPKSMNTHLHVMEAYSALAARTGDPRVRDRLSAVLIDILDHVLADDEGAFRLFFDRQWRPLTGAVSFGHDIEGAWLLTEAAHVLGDAHLIRRAERAAVQLAVAVLDHGIDDEGFILHEFEPAVGTRDGHAHRSSHWWAQAEGMVGFLEAYRITGDPAFEAAAASCWRVISRHHIDRDRGDWLKVLDADRAPDDTYPKAGPWECPYHHVRALLEAARRLTTTNTPYPAWNGQPA